MLAKPLFFKEKREALYERKIRKIIHEILTREDNLQRFFLSRLSLNASENILRIYIFFLSDKKNCSEELFFINQTYPNLIKKKMAISKEFSRIPSVIFLKDHQLEAEKKIEKILERI